MLLSSLIFVLEAVAGFFTMLLLARTVMRAMRISFVNQLGQFVLATTDWAVRPMQRLLPTVGKLDLSSLMPALLIQILLTVLEEWLRGLWLDNYAQFGVVLLTLGVLKLFKSALWLLTFVLLLGAVLSWVNPYAPIAPMLQRLSDPFLRPFRALIKPVAGVDLSPLVLLLLLSLLGFWLDSLLGGVRMLLRA